MTASRSVIPYGKNLKSGPVKNVSHKSVQTSRWNVCAHYKGHSKNVDNHINKHKEIKSFSKILYNYQANSVSGGNTNLPRIISTAKKITPNDVEETRKKLHITRISGNNAPIFINKGNTNIVNASSHHANSELRFINIKYNTKLQHVPVTQSLQKNNTKTLQNTSSNAFIFNRNPVNYNFVSKTTSSQTQELKTYSRKNDAVQSSNLTTEHKYLIHHSSDKLHKIQNNIASGVEKVVNNYYNHHQPNEMKLITSITSVNNAADNEHIKSLNNNFSNVRNISCKDDVIKGQDSALFSSSHNNCSTFMDYKPLLQTNGQ